MLEEMWYLKYLAVDISQATISCVVSYPFSLGHTRCCPKELPISKTTTDYHSSKSSLFFSVLPHIF